MDTTGTLNEYEVKHLIASLTSGTYRMYSVMRGWALRAMIIHNLNETLDYIDKRDKFRTFRATRGPFPYTQGNN